MIRIARFLFAISVIWPLTLTTALGQSVRTEQDDVTEATSKWLKSANTGDRTALNAIMDERFVATTPAGDVVTKDELMPDDPSQQVQRLQPLILGSPVVRLYGDTAVLMGRLKSADAPGRDLNGTFVYSRQTGVWKLIALHLSPQK
jgi:hypothetical protein